VLRRLSASPFAAVKIFVGEAARLSIASGLRAGRSSCSRRSNVSAPSCSRALHSKPLIPRMLGCTAPAHVSTPCAVASHATTAQDTRPNPKLPIGLGPLSPMKSCSSASPSTKLPPVGVQPAAVPRVPSLGAVKAAAPAALLPSTDAEPVRAGVSAYLSEHEEVRLACAHAGGSWEARVACRP
jgi:hypothetical protein